MNAVGEAKSGATTSRATKSGAMKSGATKPGATKPGATKSGATIDARPGAFNLAAESGAAIAALRAAAGGAKKTLLEVCGNVVKVEGLMPRIARLELDKYEFLDDPEPTIAALRKSGKADLFSFLQKLPQAPPKFDYPYEWDNLAALPVSTFDHWWNRQIKSFPRNRARQAEKRGVVLREVPYDDELARGIWEIYNECPVRQGKPFVHYGKDLDTVHRMSATWLERSIFIGAYIEAQLIGFIKLVHDSTMTQACTMHIVSMMGHKDKAPTNALIAHAVRACADRSIPFLVYQNFAYGNKQGDSLSHFKEINGFARVDLPRYYVPLTAVGKAAFGMKMHLKFADRLPAGMAEKLRELRLNWNNRKLQKAEGSGSGEDGAEKSADSGKG